ERPINRRELAVAEAHPHAVRRRPEPRGVDQCPLARHLPDELAHVIHELLARYSAAVLVDTDHRKESHIRLPVKRAGRTSAQTSFPLSSRTGWQPDRHERQNPVQGLTHTYPVGYDSNQ